jgi:hypothetical protein
MEMPGGAAPADRASGGHDRRRTKAFSGEVDFRFAEENASTQ